MLGANLGLLLYGEVSVMGSDLGAEEHEYELVPGIAHLVLIRSLCKICRKSQISSKHGHYALHTDSCERWLPFWRFLHCEQPSFLSNFSETAG